MREAFAEAQRDQATERPLRPDGSPIEDAARLGNAAGAITYDHVGVHSVTPEELSHELDRFDY